MRRTTIGLQPGTPITVACNGGRRRHGVVTIPRYVSAHGHERVEYRDEASGGLRFARIEDVRVDRRRRRMVA